MEKHCSVLSIGRVREPLFLRPLTSACARIENQGRPIVKLPPPHWQKHISLKNQLIIIDSSPAVRTQAACNSIMYRNTSPHDRKMYILAPRRNAFCILNERMLYLLLRLRCLNFLSPCFSRLHELLGTQPSRYTTQLSNHAQEEVIIYYSNDIWHLNAPPQMR